MPQSALRARNAERPSRLWWIYFALALVLFGLAFVDFATHGLSAAPSAAFIGAALLFHDAICIAGLYAFIRAIPLIAPAVWRIALTLLAARIFVGASFFLPSLLPWEGTAQQYVASTGLLMLMAGVPMLVALWRYTFRSPQVWDPTSAA